MDAGEHMDEAEERAIYGSNVRTLRKMRGMSQAELARKMQERGRKWHQSTVTRVESGEQSVDHWDSRHLAAVLETSTERLSWAGPEATEVALVLDARTTIIRRYKVVAQAVLELLAAHSTAGRVIGQHAGSKYERVHRARQDVADAMEEYDLDAAVDEGVSRFEHLHDEESSAEPGDGD